MDRPAPSLARLSDSDLVQEVARLAECERAATTELIAALMEFDARRLYLGEGCGSLFVYCTERLHLSEASAYFRIEAARAARAYPLVLERLRGGSITLSTIKLVAPHLTESNHRAVLDAVAGQSKRAAEELVARLAPRPDVRTSIRKLPEPRAAACERPMPGAGRPDAQPGRTAAESSSTAPTDGSGPHAPAASLLDDVPGSVVVDSWPVPPRPPSRPALFRPLAPERYQMQMTVSAETHGKLRQLQDLLRGEIPSGDPAEIVDRALTLLLEQVARRKFAARKDRTPRGTHHPVSVPGSQESQRPGARTTACPDGRPGRRASARIIPAAAKRAVWERDSGQCAYVGRTGRCASRGPLEFHHLVAVADGGGGSVDNLALRCSQHHDAESARVFAWSRETEPCDAGESATCGGRTPRAPTRPGTSSQGNKPSG